MSYTEEFYFTKFKKCGTKMKSKHNFGVMIQIKTKRNLLINTSRACYRKTWVYM